ncbi:hypothetical protein HK405_007382 [Cladochytrium tenue]|nr:hypothetical protein HK405_007382 [Cladochytrium tenue]
MQGANDDRDADDATAPPSPSHHRDTTDGVAGGGAVGATSTASTAAATSAAVGLAAIASTEPNAPSISPEPAVHEPAPQRAGDGLPLATISSAPSTSPADGGDSDTGASNSPEDDSNDGASSMNDGNGDGDGASHVINSASERPPLHTHSFLKHKAPNDHSKELLIKDTLVQSAYLDLQGHESVPDDDHDLDEALKLLSEAIAPPTITSADSPSAVNDESPSKLADSAGSDRAVAELARLALLVRTSRSNERSLLARARDLAADLAGAAAAARRERDVATGLRKELDRAWAQVDAARDTAAAAVASSGQSLPQNSLATRRPVLHREVEDFTPTVPVVLRPNLRRHTPETPAAPAPAPIAPPVTDPALDANYVPVARIVELEADRARLAAELAAALHTTAYIKEDASATKQARAKLEAAMQAAADLAVRRDADAAAAVADAARARETAARLDAQLRDARARTDAIARDCAAAKDRAASAEDELAALLREREAAGKMAAADAPAAGSLEDELGAARAAQRALAREKDTLGKRLKVIEDGKEAVDAELDGLKAENARLAQELTAATRQHADAERRVAASTRERDDAQRNLVRAAGAAQRQVALAKVAEAQRRALQDEAAARRDEAARARQIIYALERERDRAAARLRDLDAAAVLSAEHLRLRDAALADARKRVADLEKRLEEHTAMYEGVRADRNSYSKNLVEAQDELGELRRRLKITGHNVEQLKEEVAKRDKDLSRQQFEHQKLEKEKDGLAASVASLQQQYGDAVAATQDHAAEEARLRCAVDEGERACARLQKDLARLIHERDLIGTHLVRRDDEIALLQEKVRIFMSTLAKGESQFAERFEDIRVLKLEVRRLRRDFSARTSAAGSS